MGPFGSIGVVLMGDFAQLPSVLAASLLPGVPRTDAVARLFEPWRWPPSRPSPNLRTSNVCVVLTARRASMHAKMQRMRLRDAAVTTEDYTLWKTH
eukprot:9468915-Pyramimonas_sp.AAC.1